MKYILLSFLTLSFLGLQSIDTHQALFQIEIKSLYDNSRQRIIPVQIYKPVSDVANLPMVLPMVIINHGYGVKNTEYSFIAETLCKEGYFVISIQHDLETDSALPRTGNLFESRKPFWEQGVQTILYVLDQVKNFNKIVLIGHSNGGDIAMLFASNHPELVEKVISLDSLRMPFPTKDHIPILSLRATDTVADEGVIPEFGATIVKLNAKHIDMYDLAPEETKNEILFLIDKFLKGKF